jgi:hypothetical protein
VLFSRVYKGSSCFVVGGLEIFRVPGDLDSRSGDLCTLGELALSFFLGGDIRVSECSSWTLFWSSGLSDCEVGRASSGAGAVNVSRAGSYILAGLSVCSKTKDEVPTERLWLST